MATRPRRRMVRKRRIIRRRRAIPRAPRSRRVNDVASCSETVPFQARLFAPGTQTYNFTSGAKGSAINCYKMIDYSLNSFFRAPSIGANYQFYRIKYFELTILPDADTFAPGAASGKPYLYYMVDKGNTLNLGMTSPQLITMGAKPVVLDEKPIKIRWSPGVSLSTQISTATGTTSAQMYKVSPWLNTDATTNIIGFQASQVVHYGLTFFAENTGTGVNYTGQLTAHFEFKKPLQSQSVA